MTFARTLGGELVALDPAVIDAFSGRVAARVLVESAAGYEQARRVWNGLVDKRPAIIVPCSGVADVLDSLRFARDHNRLVAVRGGGHSVAGSGTCDGGLVIDLSPLRGIRVPACGLRYYWKGLYLDGLGDAVVRLSLLRSRVIRRRSPCSSSGRRAACSLA